MPVQFFSTYFNKIRPTTEPNFTIWESDNSINWLPLPMSLPGFTLSFKRIYSILDYSKMKNNVTMLFITEYIAKYTKIKNKKLTNKLINTLPFLIYSFGWIQIKRKRGFPFFFFF